ncbi:adenylate kinase [Halorubrum sp. 2020YC2]|uniref:adenylate kinase n=1 Tax=Halorubrum sp. 2020YC2 TaxID=2836432 RepID=UPI001BE93603|nr:adenylate kinase [Halorubrum sp. 2020YC2]QWC18879.1 adenylate kinase [Halorubrum sp. 2020YC2]
MSVTLISGVTGVGLTSICQRVRRQLDEEYLLLNFGDVMLEQAMAREIAVDREGLSSLSQRETLRLQRRAAEYVADRSETNDIILSTHLAVKTDAGYIHGLPEGVLRDVAPSTFVLVEADPSTVIERRSESGRSSTSATEREIEFEQDLNRTAALEYARERNAPVQFVENEGSVTEAVEQVVETVAATE